MTSTNSTLYRCIPINKCKYNIFTVTKKKITTNMQLEI